ncbi:T9SS type A sorting domain-containing protein [Hymenobacter sp. HD11105]
MKKNLRLGRGWLAAALSYLLLSPSYGQTTGEQPVPIISATPSVATGQDYSPWLDDNPDNKVQDSWQPANFQYVDVTLRLSQPTTLSHLSLFDFQGVFTDKPATIYAQQGTQRTLLGTFDGSQYNQWVDLPGAGGVLAEAIVIHKYCNNIPAKIRVFGQAGGETPTPTPSPAPPPTPAPAPTPTPTPAPGGNLPAGSKIPVDAARWYQLNNVGNGLAPLFDGSTATTATTGWGKILPTFEAYYPLHPGEAMTLESIRFFDGGGSNPHDPMTLSVITDTWQRIPVATFMGEQYNQWVGPNPARPQEFHLPSPRSNIRYLVLTASWAYPTELELYGSYAPGSPPSAPDPAALAQQKQIKLRQQLGVNAFEWDFADPNAPSQIDEARLAAVKNFTGIRHYLDWEKLELTEGNYTFNPTHRGGWNYDAIYERCKAEGLEVLACLKTLPPWLLATYPEGERDLENVPVRYGQDFADPRSYLEQARVGFQFMARYGYNTSLNPAQVRVNAGTRWGGDGVNQVRIGLGLIKYIECENERDKWWKGRKAYQTGREYAANLSAFYDGHRNTMGPGVGVKNADPAVQVVMGGLASPNPDYVRGMIDWCREFRGLRPDGSVNLCWDIINYHLYANDARSSQSGNSTRGAAPEVSEAAQVARDFVRLAHQQAGGMPVWITETGYDTHPGSPLKAVAVGSRSVLETQADWLLRTALLYARWGVERVFFYQLYDDKPGDAVQFSTSGLVNQDKTPKPAADFLRQAAQLLGDYTYKATISQDPLVDRYEHGNSTAYALVVPDERGRTASYTLEVGADSARIYRPRAGQATMSLTRVRTSGGRLQLTVTETPTFVVVAGAPTAAPARAARQRAGQSADAAAPPELTVYPNPFASQATLAITSPKAGPVTLAVYDAQSRLVRRVFAGTLAAGEQRRFTLAGQQLGAGIYLVRLETPGQVVSQRLTFMP